MDNEKMIDPESCISREIKEMFEKFYKIQAEWKNTWAKFGDLVENGKKFGYTLSDPLETSVIEKFEKEHNVRLPDDFRYYISTFTKELFTFAYPTIIDLEVHANFDSADFNVTDDISYFDEQLDESNSLGECSIVMGIGGCAFEDVLVIKGNRSGSIWEYTDPVYYLCARSFADLARFHVEQYERDDLYYASRNYLNDKGPLIHISFQKYKSIS